MALAFSQIDTRFTSQLHQVYSEVNFETSKGGSLALDNDFIADVAQVIHLTTAIFLLFIGTHLEYSKKGDLYVFFITLTIAIVKIFSSFEIMSKTEYGEGRSY